MRRAAPALLLALLLTACGQGQAQDPAKKAAERKPLPVTVARVETRAVQRSVETVGSLLAWEESQVKAEVAGTVDRISADLGDRVKAGQVLATVDAREFRLQVEQSEASLRMAKETQERMRAEQDEAKANLERAEELYRRELISAQERDRWRTQYRVTQALSQSSAADIQRMEAALGMSRKKLQDATIRAPITGAVAKRHVNVGEFVKDGAPLFTLVVADPLKYTGTVSERYAPELRVGQALELTVEAHPGQPFSGQVTRVAPAVEVQTRSLSLEARVPNPNGRLRPGFFAKGAVLTRKDETVTFVPAEAVTYFVGITKVFVVTDGKAEERLVKPGTRQGGWVEIQHGVKAGEAVATTNLPQLFNGAPVTVVQK
ncbi:MAG: efflux RND transporter periplasmic adaptor subunit [Candidatus Rokuibacteriota bacterium]